ncbi:hypothetical protein BGZ76_001439 [Entomortierella beljakovae]|nr:hypothetical protein BGZ76_001439 [Entomortierella beljakovae]
MPINRPHHRISIADPIAAEDITQESFAIDTITIINFNTIPTTQDTQMITDSRIVAKCDRHCRRSMGYFFRQLNRFRRLRSMIRGHRHRLQVANFRLYYQGIMRFRISKSRNRGGSLA